MMPTKDLPGVTQACGIGADDAGAVFRSGRVHRHHIQRRNVLGQHRPTI